MHCTKGQHWHRRPACKLELWCYSFAFVFSSIPSFRVCAGLSRCFIRHSERSISSQQSVQSNMLLPAAHGWICTESFEDVVVPFYSCNCFPLFVSPLQKYHMRFASSHVKLNLFRFDVVAVFTCELKFEHQQIMPHVNIFSNSLVYFSIASELQTFICDVTKNNTAFHSCSGMIGYFHKWTKINIKLWIYTNTLQTVIRIFHLLKITILAFR